jgi:tetratricopeptide (TPR) repeat protein
VLLPSLVLVVFLVRLNRQDNELRKKRAAEAKQQKAIQIGTYLTERLEETERFVLEKLISNPAIFQKNYRTHPELVFAGRIVKQKLLMPWEGAGIQNLSPERYDSRGLILEAQQTEFEKNNPKGALPIYNRALSSLDSPSQKCFIQLQQGRILSKLGDEERAQRIYHDILSKPGNLTDEYGIPLFLYAADRLSVLDSEAESILNQLEDIMEEIRWLPSCALYFIQDITSQIQNRAKDPLLLERTGNLRQSIKKAHEDLNRLDSLRGFVSSWMLRHGSSEEKSDSLTGESLKGFRLQFGETEMSAWSSPSLPFPMLYWLIPIFVVGFTMFGGYLLWRDVGRELAIAELRSQFTASVSHELKTPLTSIRMYAEALAMGVHKRPEIKKEYLQTIISESERLSRLLELIKKSKAKRKGTKDSIDVLRELRGYER